MNVKSTERSTGNLLRKGRPKVVELKLSESTLAELEAKRQELSQSYGGEVSKDDLVNSVIFNSRLETKHFKKEVMKKVRVKIMATMADKLATISKEAELEERKVLAQMIEKELGRLN